MRSSMEEICIELKFPYGKPDENGVYSGGKYAAWNCDADCVPAGISGDDTWCLTTWDNIRNCE